MDVPDTNAPAPQPEEQREFVYRVSHDLRSPISSILGYVELLETDYADQLKPEAKRYLQAVTDSARKLDAMVAGLLAYSRIGRAPDRPRNCNMATVIAFAREDAIKNSNRTDAIWKLPEQLPHVFGVESEFQNLFSHLFTNALQHNPNPKPLVELTCRDEPTRVVFTVRDNGPGIEPRFHKDIFTIYFRLDSRGPARSTGMGLALAKHIVETHGGQIWIESLAGQGATFFIALPKLT